MEGSNYFKTGNRTKLLAVAICLTCMQKFSSAQQMVSGKWYFFSRNRMIELNFKKDSLVSTQLYWNFQAFDPNDPENSQAQAIVTSLRQNEAIYLVTSNTRDSLGTVRLALVKEMAPGRQMVMVVNAPGYTFRDSVSIQKFIASDTGGKYGFTLYSENALHRLQHGKKINSMTLEDFKHYVGAINVAAGKIDSISQIPDAPPGLIYLSYAVARESLASVGYDPLITSDEFDAMIKKFQNMPEAAPYVKKLLGDH